VTWLKAHLLHAQVHNWDRMTTSDDKGAVAPYTVLQTPGWAGTHWTLSKVVQPQRGPHMLVVLRKWQESGADGEPHLLPLQAVERSPDDIVADGGRGNRLESGQMVTPADLGAVVHVIVPSSCDERAGGC
jgi:hypothetical protein